METNSVLQELNSNNFPGTLRQGRRMQKWAARLNAAVDRMGWEKRSRVRRLAAAAGITQDSARKYLGGKVAQPRGDILQRLAQAAGIDYLELRDGPNVKEASINPALASQRGEPSNNNREDDMQRQLLDIWAMLFELERRLNRIDPPLSAADRQEPDAHPRKVPGP